MSTPGRATGLGKRRATPKPVNLADFAAVNLAAALNDPSMYVHLFLYSGTKSVIHLRNAMLRIPLGSAAQLAYNAPSSVVPCLA